MDMPAELERFTRSTSRLDGDWETVVGARASPHLVATVVRCRRQPWKVHAHNRVATHQEGAEKVSTVPSIDGARALLIP